MRHAVVLMLVLCRFAFSLDEVATPPVVRGPVVDIAIDDQGNRYLTGSAYAETDFNPAAGADVQTPAGGDIFVTRYNADGSYAWTKLFGNPGYDSASGIAVSNGVVYVSGFLGAWQFKDPIPLPEPQPIPDKRELVSAPDRTSAIVLALDAQSGSLKTDFGVGGVTSYIGIGGAEASGLIVVGTTIYVTGMQYTNYNDPVPLAAGIAAPGYFAHTQKAFVLAVDTITGAEKNTFGNGGVWIYGGDDLETSGKSLTALNGKLYVAGNQLKYPLVSTVPPGDGGGGTTTSNDALYYPNGAPEQQLFVASLDLATGVADATFGKNGLRFFGAPETATASAITSGNGLLYVAGTLSFPLIYTMDATTAGAVDFWQPPASDAFVLALDAASGANVAGFADGGLKKFGRQFNDEGRDVLLVGGLLYLAGGYGNLYEMPGYNFLPAAAEDVAKPIANGDTGIAYYGTLSYSDAFVLALDPLSGKLATTFSVDGFETFGGSNHDSASAIASFGSRLFMAGESYSKDAGIGGPGSINCEIWNGFVLEMDAASGAGGGAEISRAPVVNAGEDFVARQPEVQIAIFPPPPYAWLSGSARDDGFPALPGTLTVAWKKESGPGEVAFEAPEYISTGVNFTQFGVYVLRLTLSDGESTVSDTVSVTVIQNVAPKILSEPQANPNPARAGDEVVFSAKAIDNDSEWLNYFWDFGDGNYGFDSTATNVYAFGGIYSVTLTISDGIDTLERKLELSVSPGVDGEIKIDLLDFFINFARANKDRLKIKGLLPTLPVDFNPRGQTVALNVAGVEIDFMLNKRGAGKSKSGSFKMTKKRGVWNFLAKVKGSSFGGAVAFENKTVRGEAVNVPVTLDLSGTKLTGEKSVIYSASADSSGKAR